MHAGELIAAVPKGCLKTLQSKGKDTILGTEHVLCQSQ